MASVDMDPGTAELYDRIVDLFGTRDVHPEDRRPIREAFGPGMTWETLPQEIRDLIEKNEQLPQTSGWTDPADVPDDLGDDDEIAD